MQNARRQTQASTAPTELTARTRADAGSNLSGLARSTSRYWIGSAALAAGIGAVVASITLTSTPAGQGLTLGFGAFIAFFALLSLLARNQTPTYWGQFVAGFVLFLLPWLGDGFVPDPAAAWTAWVVGFLTMALGAVGWLNSGPPTIYGINENTSSQTKPSAVAGWISRAALAVGLGTVVLGATVVQSSPAAVAVTVGLGSFTAVIAMWSLLAADPTRDYFTLSVVGFALFLTPWLAGFASNEAAWAAWIPGIIVTTLGVAGYLRGESLDFAQTVRNEADARYGQRFR
jgi:SPW repeat-containing protein